MSSEEKKKKGLGNKGFSLVELIIVIAIMAILIGIIGSQAVPYLEKSRRSKDLQTLDTVYNAFQTAITDTLTEENFKDFTGATLDTISDSSMSDSTKLKANLKMMLGASMQTAADLKKKFKSADGGKSASDVLFTYYGAGAPASAGYIGVSVNKLNVNNQS